MRNLIDGPSRGFEPGEYNYAGPTEGANAPPRAVRRKGRRHLRSVLRRQGDANSTTLRFEADVLRRVSRLANSIVRSSK